MSKYLILFYLIISNYVSAQDSLVVEVRVVSVLYGEPIHNVTVTMEYGSSIEFRMTNTKGLVSITVPKGISINFKLSHNQFLSDKNPTKNLTSKSSIDTVQFEFEMEFIKAQDLESIVVYASGVPETVFGSKKLHVEDFEMMNNDEILLLTYQKRLKKGSELKLFDGTKVISSFQVPGVAQDLLHDFRGNPHIICSDNVFGVHADNGDVSISILDKGYFMTYLAPILDTNEMKMYFSNFNEDYPAFEYFYFDRLDSTYKKIMDIKDDLMMELYRSEYKWVDVRTRLWAKNKEIKTGIDAEVWVGANYFTQSIYYKEAFSPLFHRNDSLFVFDYYKDFLYTYDSDGELLDSVGIYHHYNPRASGWKRKVLQDKKSGEIYAVFNRAGYSYIGRIDTKTGEIPEQVKLKHRYIEKIQIHGDRVYYTYRPFESPQKKYLYREKLPYSFSNKSLK